MAIQKPEWFKQDASKFLSDRQVDAMSAGTRRMLAADVPETRRMLAADVPAVD